MNFYINFLLIIILLSFSDSLATKCKYLNNQPCATRPTLINLDPDEHNQAYYG